MQGGGEAGAVAGCNTQDVTIFNIEDGENVVSAVRVDGRMVAEDEGEEETGGEV